MFLWRKDSETRHSLVFEGNPDGVGFGVVQRLMSGDKVIWRWAPLLKDIYQARATVDFDYEPKKVRDPAQADRTCEASARRCGVEKTLALLARFGLRENPL